MIRKARGDITDEDKRRSLNAWQKILASTLGGALSCWNQPIEVIRVEMQSQVKQAGALYCVCVCDFLA